MAPHDLLSERFTLWLLCINFVALNDVFSTKWQHPIIQTYNSMGDIFAHFNTGINSASETIHWQLDNSYLTVSYRILYNALCQQYPLFPNNLLKLIV